MIKNGSNKIKFLTAKDKSKEMDLNLNFCKKTGKNELKIDKTVKERE